MNHMPWDNGAISDTLDNVIGFHVEHKTTKTRCNKRVAISKANHKQPTTCTECLADIAAEKQFAETMRQTFTK